MSRRTRKKRKRREKRLERVPEKLQRKRERRVRYQIQRMPNWIKATLVLAVIIIIVVGAAWALAPKTVPPSPTLTKGDVYFLQQDLFYCNITTTGEVKLDFMEALFGVGTLGGEQPLHIIATDTFAEDRNITLVKNIIWDYYGNAFELNPDINSRSISFEIGDIYPPIEVERTLGTNVHGYWSLFFGYLLNSSNDPALASDNLENLFTFNFTIHMENNTLLYNTPTIVNCTITMTPQPIPPIRYSDGLAYIEFPAKIYNESTLLAELSLHDVHQVGTAMDGEYTENETLITFKDTFTSLNTTWGFVFDLNVTAYTNNSFTLLDLTTEQCEFSFQAGESGSVPNQRMHFPNVTLDVRTPYNDLYFSNYTDVYIRLPKILADVSAPPGNSTPSTSSPIYLLHEGNLPQPTSNQYLERSNSLRTTENNSPLNLLKPDSDWQPTVLIAIWASRNGCCSYLSL